MGQDEAAAAGGWWLGPGSSPLSPGRLVGQQNPVPGGALGGPSRSPPPQVPRQMCRGTLSCPTRALQVVPGPGGGGAGVQPVRLPSPNEAQSVSTGRGLPETHTEAAWVQVPRMTAVTPMSPVKPGGQTGGGGTAGDNTECGIAKSCRAGCRAARAGAEAAAGLATRPPRVHPPERCLCSLEPGILNTARTVPRETGFPPG